MADTDADVKDPGNFEKFLNNLAKSSPSSSSGLGDAIKAGGDLAEQVIQGVSGASAQALTAGVQVSSVLIEGLMQPLGQSGASISKLAETAGSAVIGIGQAVASGASAVLQGGVQIASAAVNSFMSVATQVGGAIMGTVQQIASAANPIAGAVLGAVSSIASSVLSAVTSLLSSLATAIVSTLTGLLQAAGQILGQLGQVVAQGFQTLIGVLQDVFGTAMSEAKNITALSNNTGMSMDESQRMATNFGALGVDSSALAKSFTGAGMSETMFKDRAQMVGILDDKGEFSQSKFAEKYQELANSGPYGHEQAENMRQFVGLTSPDMLRVANMDPGKIKKEQEYAHGLQSSLGVSPDMLKKFAEDFPALINRISEFVNMVKVRFASELMPAVSGALTQLTQFVSKNAGAIAGGLKTAAMWLVNDLPQLVISGFSAVLGAGIMFMEIMQSIGDAIADELTSFSNGEGLIYSVLSAIATFIDYVTVGFGGLISVLAPILAVVYDIGAVFSNVSILFVKGIGFIASAILDFAASVPLLKHLVPKEARDIAHGMRDMSLAPFVNPMDAYNLGANMGTDYQGDVLNMQNSGTPERMAKKLHQAHKIEDSYIKGGKALKKKTDAAGKTVSDLFHATQEGNEQRKQATEYQRQTAHNTDKIHNKMGGDKKVDMAQRMGMLLVQSWRLDQSRG